MWLLKRCAKPGKIYNQLFLLSFRNLSRLDDHIQYGRNGIEIKWLWLCGVLKCIGRFKIRLKAIEYKKNFFFYLSSYSDLDLQAVCF